jgi:hypothetical protein
MGSRASTVSYGRVLGLFERTQIARGICPFQPLSFAYDGNAAHSRTWAARNRGWTYDDPAISSNGTTS